MNTEINKKSIIILLIISAFIFLNCSGNSYRNYVKVRGDVNNVLFFNKLDDKDIIPLNDILTKAEPRFENYSIMLVGSDGLAAKIDNRVHNVTLNFSEMNGWEIIDKSHPVSAQIKHLKEIVVVSEEEYPENSVIIFNSEINIEAFTPGQLYLKSLERSFTFEGRSKLIRDDGEYSVTVYTTSMLYPLDHLDGSRHMVISSDGKNKYITDPGYLVLKDNTINYLDTKKENEIFDVKGILVDPPKKSISDAYYDALYYVENGEKVMVIFLDGFSYKLYEYALENNIAPFLKDLPVADKATTFFKPVTNVGFAAMITGQGPAENGIHNRSHRKLNSSIFTVLKEKGYSSKLIEADVSILDHGAEEILNIDTNKNDNIDDEVFDSAMKEINKHDYMLVHFHSIDDMGHKYGPFGDKTLEQITIKDRYVKELTENFNGKIIILADHGMHTTQDGGTHCQTRIEDFIVPYLTIKGEK